MDWEIPLTQASKSFFTSAAGWGIGHFCKSSSIHKQFHIIIFCYFHLSMAQLVTHILSTLLYFNSTHLLCGESPTIVCHIYVSLTSQVFSTTVFNVDPQSPPCNTRPILHLCIHQILLKHLLLSLIIPNFHFLSSIFHPLLWNYT